MAQMSSHTPQNKGGRFQHTVGRADYIHCIPFTKPHATFRHMNASMISTASRLAPLCLATWACLLMPSVAAAQTTSTVEDQYRLGLYQRETGLPFSSIDTLESVLSSDPSLNRARLELAVAYYRTLNFSRARAEAERVLNDPKTPDPVRLSVSSFLKQLELDERNTFGKPHRFEVGTSLGLLYDSNVNAGPNSALLGSFGGGQLVLDQKDVSKSDWAYVAQANLNHTWQRPSPVRIGESVGRFSWNSSASLYQKGYKKYNDYDLGVVTLATGPGLIVGQSWRGNINLQLDQITLGSRQLGLYTSVNPSATWRVAGGGELTADGQWSSRRFTRSDDAGRNSQYQNVGLSYGRLMGNKTWSLQGGLHLFNESAADERFSNRGQEVFVGASTALRGIDLYARTALRNSRYIGIEPVFGIAREEQERRIELGASHAFVEGWLNKWVLSATVANVHNKANISLYGYDRDTITFTLNRSF